MMYVMVVLGPKVTIWLTYVCFGWVEYGWGHYRLQ